MKGTMYDPNHVYETARKVFNQASEAYDRGDMKMCEDLRQRALGLEHRADVLMLEQLGFEPEQFPAA